MKNKIREIEKLEDFKEVYQVFSGAPYYEKYTEKELAEIFLEYQKNGYMYGAYKEEKCIGLVALERGVAKGQPVKFQEEKMMYLADVAVLESYRKTGLGTQLMLFAVMQSKILGYQKIYMRTLEEKSMSFGIARKIGFQQIPCVYQKVERQRMDGSMTAVQNIFLEFDLNTLDKKFFRQQIECSSEQFLREEEEKC